MHLTHGVDNDRDNVAGVSSLPSRLRACGHCRADFLPRRARSRNQRFCSRSCASLARPARPVALRPPRSDDNHARLILRLLDIQPLERRARGGWRFGTKCIGDALVARLIASGRAEIRGERLHHVREA